MNRNTGYKDKKPEGAGTELGTGARVKKSVLALTLAMMLTLSLTACGSAAATSDLGSSVETASTETADNAVSKSEMFTERDLSGDYDESEAETITLSGSSAKTSAASGVSIDGSVITISAEGVYIVSGTLADGRSS